MLIYCLIAGFLSKWQHNISNEGVENLKLHLLLKEGINPKKAKHVTCGPSHVFGSTVDWIGYQHFINSKSQFGSAASFVQNKRRCSGTQPRDTKSADFFSFHLEFEFFF